MSMKRNHAPIRGSIETSLNIKCGFFIWMFNVQWKEKWLFSCKQNAKGEKVSTHLKQNKRKTKRKMKTSICVFDFGWPCSSPSPDRLLNIPSKILVI